MSQLSFLRPFLVTCGVSLVLVGCGGGTSTANSRAIRFLSIQPIQVCDDFGIFCADLALFEAETRKIWANVDIEITFLAPNRLLASRFLSIDTQAEFAELSFEGGAGAFGRHPLSTRTSGPINMWFVDEILLGAGEVFGLAWLGQNGVLISDNIRSFNGGIGRRDTVAHEIGHNLGLSHDDEGAGAANNLMSSGSVRAIPNSVADISPDGAGLSRLSNEQASRARTSGFLRDGAGISGAPASADPPSPSLLEQILRFLQGEDDDHLHEHFDAIARSPVAPAPSLPLPFSSQPPPAVVLTDFQPLTDAWGAMPTPGFEVDSLLPASTWSHRSGAQSVPEPASHPWIPGSVLLGGAGAGWWRRRSR